MSQHPALRATQLWLNAFVIEYSICPFARHPGLRSCLIEQQDVAQSLQSLADELLELQRNPEIQSSLLIFADLYADFDDYLDGLALAEQLIFDLDFDGVYQLASFHPHYQFEGADDDDAANYTNRSPYPMWHIIRESAISAALKQFPQPENIPLRNIALTRKLGVEQLQTILKTCYQANEQA